MLVGETFYYAEEAYTALEIIQKAGLACSHHNCSNGRKYYERWSLNIDTMKELEQRGADVVGMNCFRGPDTMMPYLREAREGFLSVIWQHYHFHSEQQTNIPLSLICLMNNGCTCQHRMEEHFQQPLILFIVIGMKCRALVEEAA